MKQVFITLSQVFVAKSHDTALADVRIFDGKTNKLPEKIPALETGNIEPIPAVISCAFPKSNDASPAFLKVKPGSGQA